MTKNEEFKENSQAVQSHLGITQSVIQRMASNSSSSKAWCIALVSAILVLVANSGEPNFVFIAIVPVLLFLVLDTYYLALERAFRESYNSFIEKLHSSSIMSSDLYIVSPKGSIPKLFFHSLSSFSIWPFYLTLLVMILIARAFLF